EHHGFDRVALLEALRGMLDLLRPGDVRDVDETVDPLLETHEDPEVGDVADLARDARTDRVALLDHGPGILLDLLHAERDLPIALVDVEDDGLHLIADRDDLRR